MKAERGIKMKTIINGKKHVVNTSAKMSKVANDIVFASKISKEIEIRHNKLFVIRDSFWLNCKESTPLDLVKVEYNRRRLFNKKVSCKQRGRLYKITLYLKGLIEKYNGWLEDIQPNEIKYLLNMCQKWHIDKDILWEVLSDYTYDDDDSHAYLPPTFDFMCEVEELRRGKLLRNF